MDDITGPGYERWTIRWTLDYEGKQHTSIKGERPEYDQESTWNGFTMDKWAEVEVVPASQLQGAVEALRLIALHSYDEPSSLIEARLIARKALEAMGTNLSGGQ